MNCIAHGIDCVEVERFRQLLTRRPRVVQKCFSDPEIKYSFRVSDPSERLDVRFAAREAVLKALECGIGSVALREIEVIRSSSGKPEIRLSGKALERSKNRGINHWIVSLTHTKSLAQASVIGLEKRG